MSVYNAPYGGAQGAGGLPPRPPVVRQQIRASKEFFDANSHEQVVAIAGIIMQRHWGDVSQFILAQRQMGMVLPASYKRKDYPDLSMEYQRLSNQETVILTAYPETLNPNPSALDMEINYDGYFVWVHCEANPFSTDGAIINGSDFVPGPFDVFFNDYLLEENFAPARPFGGYLVLFGKTALLCESVQDKAHKNTLYEHANARQKPKLVTPPPGWGVYDAGVTPAGVEQAKIDKILGYWIFDFQDPRNPMLSLVDKNNPNNTVRWSDRAGPNGLGNPNITRGVWFEDAAKSPLDYKGGNNTFYFALSAGGKSGEVPLIGSCFAEFYDRQKGRTVRQSWTKDYDGQRFISINDSPMRWGTGYQGGGFLGGSGVTVNLTPGIKNANDLGPHDGVDGSFGNGGTGGFEQYLSPDDLAKYEAWKAEIVQIAAAYQQAIQQYIDAWNQRWASEANQKRINQAQNVVGWWSALVDANGKPYIPYRDGTTGDVTGQDRVYALGPGFQPIYGPVQEYLWSWNARYTGNNPLPKVASRYIATYGLAHGFQVFDNSGSPGGPLDHLDDYGGSLANSNSYMTVATAFAWADAYVVDPNQNALLQRDQEYAQIFIDHPSPTLPDRPKLGRDYKRFSYRAITGANGDFSYPANFSGGS